MTQHRPEDPVETERWEADKAATAAAAAVRPGGPVLSPAPVLNPADPPPAAAACGAPFPGTDLTCTLQPGHAGVHHHAGDVRGYTWSDPTPAVMRPRLPEDALLRHPRPAPRRRHDMHGLSTDQQLRLHGLREAIRWTDWSDLDPESSRDLYRLADEMTAYIRDGNRP